MGKEQDEIYYNLFNPRGDGLSAESLGISVASLGGVPSYLTINSYPLTTNVSLTTEDIADSTNKRYCTDAQKTVIGNTSGTNTGNQDLSSYITKSISIAMSIALG